MNFKDKDQGNDDEEEESESYEKTFDKTVVRTGCLDASQRPWYLILTLPFRIIEIVATVLLFALILYLMTISESGITNVTSILVVVLTLAYSFFALIQIIAHYAGSNLPEYPFVFANFLGIGFYLATGCTILYTAPTRSWGRISSFILCFVIAVLHAASFLLVLVFWRQRFIDLQKCLKTSNKVHPSTEVLYARKGRYGLSDTCQCDMATSMSNCEVLTTVADDAAVKAHGCRKIGTGHRRIYVDKKCSCLKICIPKVTEVQTECQSNLTESTQVCVEMKEIITQTTDRCELCNREIIDSSYKQVTSVPSDDQHIDIISQTSGPAFSPPCVQQLSVEPPCAPPPSVPAPCFQPFCGPPPRAQPFCVQSSRSAARAQPPCLPAPCSQPPRALASCAPPPCVGSPCAQPPCAPSPCAQPPCVPLPVPRAQMSSQTIPSMPCMSSSTQTTSLTQQASQGIQCDCVSPSPATTSKTTTIISPVAMDSKPCCGACNCGQMTQLPQCPAQLAVQPPAQSQKSASAYAESSLAMEPGQYYVVNPCTKTAKIICPGFEPRQRTNIKTKSSDVSCTSSDHQSSSTVQLQKNKRTQTNDKIECSSDCSDDKNKLCTCEKCFYKKNLAEDMAKLEVIDKKISNISNEIEHLKSFNDNTESGNSVMSRMKPLYREPLEISEKKSGYESSNKKKRDKRLNISRKSEHSIKSIKSHRDKEQLSEPPKKSRSKVSPSSSEKRMSQSLRKGHEMSAKANKSDNLNKFIDQSKASDLSMRTKDPKDEQQSQSSQQPPGSYYPIVDSRSSHRNYEYMIQTIEEEEEEDIKKEFPEEF